MFDEWANIHRQGTDAEKGDVLIAKGKKLNVGDVGVLASVGKSTVRVQALPKVAIISTGDELVEVHEQPLPHQIRKSNSHTISALLLNHGIVFERFHFNDNEEEIRKGLSVIIEEFDVILMSGGVSKGKRDYVPEMLEELGVTKHFHRVAQRPGKPLWFGSNDKVTVFGFPGNPVSTLVCFQVYFQEWLADSLGYELPNIQVKLTSTIHFKPDMTYFVPVQLRFEGHELVATPFQGHGSGDLVNLSQADGFIELPSGREVFEQGDVFNLVGFKL
jgi:molybdopterin molybdotransferase